LNAMENDAGLTLTELKVDGGASVNNVLMQFQSDILGALVHRPRIFETTALGAAFLAGLAVGVFRDTREITDKWQSGGVYRPQMEEAEMEAKYAAWKKAVVRSFAQA